MRKEKNVPTDGASFIQINHALVGFSQNGGSFRVVLLQTASAVIRTIGWDTMGA